MTKMTKAIIITSSILLLSACSSSNEKEQAFITSKEQAKSNVSVTNNPFFKEKKKERSSIYMESVMQATNMRFTLLHMKVYSFTKIISGMKRSLINMIIWAFRLQTTAFIHQGIRKKVHL